MSKKITGTGRRTFLQNLVLGAGAAAQPAGSSPADAAASRTSESSSLPTSPADILYPSIFRGRQLALIAFPLGGVAAGSISVEGAVNCAIGKFSTVPTKAIHRLMPFLPSGHKPETADPLRASSKLASNRRMRDRAGSVPRTRPVRNVWLPQVSPASSLLPKSIFRIDPCPFVSRLTRSRPSSRMKPTIRDFL
jgi:hypothetical protein